MANALTPMDFLNPLTPLRLGVGGAKILGSSVAGGVGSVARGTVDTLARGAATATDPLAGAASATAGAASDVAGFLSLSVLEAGKTFRDTNKKILIGEAVLVGGVVALAAIAAWYLSKSPEAREKVWAGGTTAAKMLLTKGAG